MMLDPFTFMGIFAISITAAGFGFAIALIAMADKDPEEEYGDTCTNNQHLFQLDPHKEINYCFCEKESWKTDEHNLVIIKS